MAQQPFLLVPELEQYGLSWEFLDQFRPVPIEVQITTAGALGTMAIAWRKRGETTFGPSVFSSAITPWVTRLSDVYADVTFPAGAYVLNSIYTIDEAGNVTVSGGGIGGVTASRYDLRPLTIQATTDEIMTRIGAAVVAPLLSWSADFKEGCGAISAYELRSKKGLSSVDAAAGDGNVISRAALWRAFFDRIGESKTLPPGVVDSSSDGVPGNLLLETQSDDPRGW